MSRVEIRALAESDIEATVLLWRRSREDAQPDLEARMGHSPQDDLAFFTSKLLVDCEVWIAVRGDRPLALLAIAGDFIEQLYVDPAEQRRGIGTLLLDFAKSRCPLGLRLHTHVTNTRARRFYEKHGFRAVAFGISPAPESEPDVRYEWNDAATSTSTPVR
jgi:ribosomal protein S18 acetylase RimI-like enzyme